MICPRCLADTLDAFIPNDGSAFAARQRRAARGIVRRAERREQEIIKELRSKPGQMLPPRPPPPKRARTNFDRIAASPEALADALAVAPDACGLCAATECEPSTTCRAGVLAWLVQEAEL